MKFAFRQGLIWIPIEIIYEGQAVKIQDCIVDTGSATTAKIRVRVRSHTTPLAVICMGHYYPKTHTSPTT